MELRQLNYFVSLAEELHFGRAAAREHIVQSALSQQLQRLERELGVLLVTRTTHHVQLTTAGAAFLTEARQIVAHVDRATVTARRAATATPTLRIGTVDASYHSTSAIIAHVQERCPDLEIHEVEAVMPEQFKLLAQGQLDVGIGLASLAPSDVASEVFRLDPLGVLVHGSHLLAQAPGIPVAKLATESLLLAEERRAPEFNQFLIDLCRSVGFTPTVYRGSVGSIRAGAELVGRRRCVLCAPASCVSGLSGIVWRPLVEPVPRYPWSVLWRADDRSEHVRAVVASARALSRQRGWLEPARQEAG